MLIKKKVHSTTALKGIPEFYLKNLNMHVSLYNKPLQYYGTKISLKPLPEIKGIIKIK